MTVFKVQEVIDAQPIRPIHLRILAICVFIMFIDGLDIFLVGKIAPAIVQDMGETSAAMTLVFLFQQIGLAVGAFTATPLADRFGRRRLLILCSCVFGVLTFLTGFATTIWQLALLRGASGLFLSGGLPIAVSLLSELTPQRRRGTFIAISFAGYSLGGAAGGAIAAWVIDIHGWQSGFWIGGVLPLLSIPLMIFCLPESLPFLVLRNPRDPRIPATIRRLAPDVRLTGDEIFQTSAGAATLQQTRLLDIFRAGRARNTTILWIACVLSMGNIALMAAWLPTFFHDMAGIPIQRFAVFAMIAFLGGLAGTFMMGWLLDRIRASRLIPAFYLMLGGVIMLLGIIPFEARLFVVVLMAFNFFQTGGQTGLNTMMTKVYPTSMRATGLGWAGGAGRIGGILLPVMGGLAVSAHLSLQQTMAIIGVMPVIVACAVLFLRDPSTGADAPDQQSSA